MSFTNQKFTGTNPEFFYTLRKRVGQYFEERGKSKYSNASMVLKTITMLLLYIVPYIILITVDIANPVIYVSLWILVGCGMSGIGLSIMHDANHSSYSKKKWVNKYLGYTMNVIGANAEIWKLQHNRLHHTYTNIEGADEDINGPNFLRFSPYKKRYGIHKLQFIYVWFFYGISTLFWMTVKEFLQIYRYRKSGLINSKKQFRKLFGQLIFWKAFYYSYILLVPILVHPDKVWLTLLSFFLMHFTAGIILSLIFQTAHVMPACEFSTVSKTGVIENDWAVHEMLTTTNFSPKSKVFSWLIGGLNFQVEHHLFPNICHVHYKQISEIVANTANEFGVKYNTQRNFVVAVYNHIKMLYILGRMEPIAVKE